MYMLIVEGGEIGLIKKFLKWLDMNKIVVLYWMKLNKEIRIQKKS